MFSRKDTTNIQTTGKFFIIRCCNEPYVLIAIDVTYAMIFFAVIGAWPKPKYLGIPDCQRARTRAEFYTPDEYNEFLQKLHEVEGSWMQQLSFCSHCWMSCF